MAGYLLLATYDGSAPQPYQVRRGGDGVLYCTCRGWVSNKTANRNNGSREPAACKHTKDYVAENPGTPYVLGKGASQYEVSAPSPSGKVTGKVTGKVKAVVKPTVAASPAPKNWRDVLLAETERAARRGMVTPASAAAEFREEIKSFLDLDEPVGPVGAAKVVAGMLDFDE